ncbi:MAG: radical SAM protein [Candidatus Omnitrophota bacterium]
MNLPYLIFSDKKGNIYRHPYLRMAAGNFGNYVIPQDNELISLPKGSTLFYMPGRLAVGYNHKQNTFEVVTDFEGKEVFAAAGFLIPAYLRLHIPATVVQKDIRLPLWAYTACGFYSGRFYAAAKRIDSRVRQSPRFYDKSKIMKSVKYFLNKYPENRLYTHLANCALNYNCLAAKNLFLKRWEAPLPTSRFCNAGCIGCLSRQDSGCASSHKRISFRPKVKEIYEVMLNHLIHAREAIVSFGQGCEGEPLLEGEIISKSVEAVRSATKRGTININTNASLPLRIKMLCEAGVDSFRVSLNSLFSGNYNLYFRPRNYRFKDVLKSIETAKKYGKFVSINLFVFPGISDSQKEIDALLLFIKNTGIDMIQWRNLNIDPDFYLRTIHHDRIQPGGISYLLNQVQSEFPRIKTGYFNLPKEKFK